MSKQNKANKSNYVQAGRLTPDDMARERQRQAAGAKAPAREDTAPAGKAPQAGREHDGWITGRGRAPEASSRRRNEREE